MNRIAYRGLRPPNWSVIRESVKNESQWRCESCRKSQGALGEDSVDVVPFDRDFSNIRRPNLVPLCLGCCSLFESLPPPCEPILFTPPAWMLPYYAAFFASGGGVAPPDFDLVTWKNRYESETGRQWPDWAQRPPTIVGERFPAACYHLE